MRKLFKNRKESGAIDHLLPGFIIVIVVFVLFIMYINTASVVAIRENVDTIVREYLLKAETAGWLDADDTAAMVAKIEGLGNSNITVENVRVGGSVANYDSSKVTSSVSGPVGYANTISIEVEADIVDHRTGSGAWGIPVTTANFDLHVRKESTAKY